MIVKEIIDQQVWNSYFNNNGSRSFLQSWEWGEFEKSQGYQIYRLGIYDDDLVAIALVIRIVSKRGRFLLVPHGPIFEIQSSKSKVQKYLAKLKNWLIELARKKNCSFIRVAPILNSTEENKKIFADLGFRTAPIYMHAETTWVLPLDKPEEELLSAMRKTTRYLIRKAAKDNVTIEKRTDSHAPEDFYPLFMETTKREKFVPFSLDFISQEFNVFNKTGNALFLFGKLKQESKYLASALVVFTKSTAFYHQGASIHTKYPAPYLLQWEAIKEAKSRGCQYYNFWGISEPGRTPKSWTGLTLFKQGFGGNKIQYLPTQDLVLSPKYYFNWLYEKYLFLKRGI